MFQLHSDYSPAGDQPQAIHQLVDGLKTGKNHQILLGVTGSGKTFTMANVIAELNRPALIMAHNKTLAAQLCSEFREFFPNNAVEYFVSYYDYYQPEAYIASRDIYIEKEAQINEEIERLRHSATRSLLSRRDVIIVASVSCIYGLGLPEDYIRGVISLNLGDVVVRRQLFLSLDKAQYERNEIELKPGRYRAKGDCIDIYPSWAEYLVRLEFFGDELDRIALIDPINGNELERRESIDIYPATHYVVNDQLQDAMMAIKKELTTRVDELKSKGKEFEARRLEQRTNYDLDMMAEVGYCKGIENYSRQLSRRPAGTAPGVLLDFFPKDFVTFIDESHVSVPQVRGMFGGDQSRKQALIDYGFRLPSALDNRPLKFDEFESKIGRVVYVTATPGPYELSKTRKHDAASDGPVNWDNYEVAQQIIRPTGLVDPQVSVRPTLYQVDNLLIEIQHVIERGERVLVTTLTKAMSEELSDYLQKQGKKVCYLHSEIHSLDRIDILHDLRMGKYDILVGVNLLREGLDLPEVSLVAIMDADKEGFLRNERSLIQTMGRAARNINGKVILYADKMTESMKNAIHETERRRAIQLAHNEAHGIVPQSVSRKISDIRDEDRRKIIEIEQKKLTVKAGELPALIAQLQMEMKAAAKNLEFELAAVLRDQIESLKGADPVV
ncbi:excinuclease ABC subunit UvrB [bacterium]|nr:excinuclease ABC subunit UvrB [bacterium]